MFKKHKKLIIIVSGALIVLMVVFFSFGDSNITFVENFVGTATKPITSFFSNTFDSIGGLFFSTSKENEILTEENAQLKREIQQLEEAQSENDRLRELLNYQEEGAQYEYVSTSVMAKTGNYAFNSFTISIGKSQGVDVGMPVVSKDGLIGKIEESGTTWSKVTSIIDPTSSVSALVERTRDNGTIKGYLNTDTLEYTLMMEFLPADTQIAPGDKIITSGLEGIYPKGLVVGTVSEVITNDDGGKSAIVTPVTDFERIEDVMVIKSNSNKDFLG